MMASPQNSPRGRFAKERIDVGSQNFTYTSTAVVLSGGLTLGGIMTGSGVGGGIVLASTAALPGAVSLEGLGLLSNSTGNAIIVNTTGTTWKYLNVTTDQPT
jgi:hypothetical protein